MFSSTSSHSLGPSNAATLVSFFQNNIELLNNANITTKDAPEDKAAGVDDNPAYHYTMIGIGAIFKDVIMSIPTSIPEDGKIAATGMSTRVGGNVVNTFRVLSQMIAGRGYPLGLLAALGEGSRAAGAQDETESRKVIKEVEGNGGRGGVKWECILRQNTELATAWIFENAETGGRSIVSFNQVEQPSCAELLLMLDLFFAKHVGPDILTTTIPLWVHVEGRNLDEVKGFIVDLRQRTFMEIGKRPIFSLDAENYSRGGVFEAQKRCDVIFTSASNCEDMKFATTEEQRRKFILEQCTKICLLKTVREDSVVYITMGDIGCLVIHTETCQFPTRRGKRDMFIGSACTMMKTAVTSRIATKKTKTGTAFTALRYPPTCELIQLQSLAYKEWKVFLIGPDPTCSKVVETVGAGDTFCAAVIYALQSGLDVVEAGVVGNMVAGKKCTQNGFEGIWEGILKDMSS